MIQLTSRFFDTSAEDPRSYSSAQWSEVFRFLAGDGVIPSEGEEFKVIERTPLSLGVVVKTGVAFIKGRYCRLEINTNLELDAASPTNPRIDRIVLRLDLNNKYIYLDVLKGTPAASPVPPTLTRTDLIYEISVARVRVNAGVASVDNSNITDERNNYEVCGFGLPFGWLVNQRVITAPREDEIIRDENGNITETKHYIPNKSQGVLRWKDTIERDEDGYITKIIRNAFADDETIIFTSTEDIYRDGDGNIKKVVTK